MMVTGWLGWWQLLVSAGWGVWQSWQRLVCVGVCGGYVCVYVCVRVSVCVCVFVSELLE